MNKALTTIKAYKLVVIILCFTLTSVFIYWHPSSRAIEKKVPLAQALSDIKGWKSDKSTLLDPKIIKVLKLDDHINQTYSKDNNDVSLYIGYYLTTKKVGAAHDPLVCFPGQGWVLSHIRKGELNINSESGRSISYSIMIAQKRTQKELIIYWFQSYEKTNPGTFSQKLASLYQKIFKHREDNAFVRISTPIGEKSVSECSQIIFNFIKAFYPVFLNYVKHG